MTSSVKIDKSFWGKHSSVQYDCSIDLNYLALISVFKTCSELISNLIHKQKFLINLKGRDQLNTINLQAGLPFDNELFSYQISQKVQGETAKAEKQFSSYYLLTPFSHFEENNIAHSVQQKTISTDKTELTLSTLLIDAEADRKLSAFRLGLDLYGQSGFASWYFKTQVVNRTLLIEANEERLSLRLTADSLRKDQPLLADPVENFLRGISLVLAFDLVQDLTSRTSAII